MKYQNLIFDFDGTLADSLEEGRLIFNDFAKKHDIDEIKKEDLNTLKNYNLKEFLKIKKLSKARFLQFIAVAKIELGKRISKIPLIENVEMLLPKLQQHTNFMGILTSNSQKNVEVFLKENQLLGYFDHIGSSSKLLNKSRYINAMLKKYSLNRHETLFIGDEIRDIQASHKSKIDVAAVTWGFNSRTSLKKEKPTFCFDTPKDLLNLITPTT